MLLVAVVGALVPASNYVMQQDQYIITIQYTVPLALENF